jgi:hypothetical protein
MLGIAVPLEVMPVVCSVMYSMAATVVMRQLLRGGCKTLPAFAGLATMGVADARSPEWRLLSPKAALLMSRQKTELEQSEITEEMCLT